MSKRHQNLSTRTLTKVLLAIAAHGQKDKEAAKIYCKELTVVLDKLLADDFFGTEGQLDPRGDHRA